MKNVSRSVLAVGFASMVWWPLTAGSAEVAADAAGATGDSGAVEAGPIVPAEATAAEAAVRSPHHASLVRAISEKRLLHFTYGGHPRVVEPYAYGVTAEGEVVLHGYQVAGGSSSKPPPGWRTFTVGGMTDLLVTERSFRRTRADYSAARLKLVPQWAEVELVAEPATEE